MHKALQETCKSLDDLYSSVLNGWTENRDLSEIYGWNWPSVNRHTLANIPYVLAQKIRESGANDLDGDLEKEIQIGNKSITNLKAHTLPHLFNGNGAAAVPVYVSSLACIESIFQPLFSWKAINDNKVLPPTLSRRLRSIEADLDEITPKKDELESQIKLIQDATEAAENLPTDLQKLKDARNKVDALATNAAELFGKIDLYNQQADKKAKYLNQQSDIELQALQHKNIEAQKLVQQCEEAYRITTSTGLAAAFDERAKSSSNSVIIWAFCLVVALGISTYTGSARVAALSNLVNVSDPQWGIIWLNIVLSVLSIGAPIWFAWLSTKQINQRFRLSEDYAFKASVAKAYEGYRREAVRIDPLLEARLFSSALTRLEEAPLRFVSDDIHGSPWQELFASKPFQEALANIPEFKNTVVA